MERSESMKRGELIELIRSNQSPELLRSFVVPSSWKSTMVESGVSLERVTFSPYVSGPIEMWPYQYDAMLSSMVEFA